MFTTLPSSVRFFVLHQLWTETLQTELWYQQPKSILLTTHMCYDAGWYSKFVSCAHRPATRKTLLTHTGGLTIISHGLGCIREASWCQNWVAGDSLWTETLVLSKYYTCNAHLEKNLFGGKLSRQTTSSHEKKQVRSLITSELLSFKCTTINIGLIYWQLIEQKYRSVQYPC